MSRSRSKFYVDLPLGRDPPSQRHSMYVSQSVVDGSPKQDLSSASSSTTLPSTAGSVDRLTGLGEKKTPRFFTLKPKTSFSLRPFFSSASIASLSPSKRRRKSIESATPRRDSYMQTDEDERAYDEVGVQTLNASTVDVPVQTSFREWDESDIYSYNRRPYSAGAYRPIFQRWPSAGYSSNSNLQAGSKSTITVPEEPIGTKSSLVAPLAPTKLLKYSVPSVSPSFTNTKISSVEDVNISDGPAVPLKVSSASPTPLSTSVPVKYFSARELTNYSRQSPKPRPDNLNCGVQLESNQPNLATITNSDSVTCGDFQGLEQPASTQLADTGKYTDVLNNSKTISIREDSKKKQTEVSEVRNEFSTPLLTVIDKPPSALKIERTDSPIRHSPKVNKSVHFVLSDSDSNYATPKKDNESLSPRNLDKDFEALLRDLDILTDEPNDQSFSESSIPLKFPLSPTLECPPKQTLFSANLKSAFDSLGHDVLPVILENVDEVIEIDSKVDELKSDKNETNSECDSRKSLINFVSIPVKELKTSDCPTPTPKLNEEESKLTDSKDDSLEFTSATVFTTAKLDLDAEDDGKRENVYDSGIKESTLKTVQLPTLPSFFDTQSQCNQPTTNTIEDREIGLSIATPIVLESDKDNMLSRSSSRSSMRSNSRAELIDSTKKFESCENLDQLEEEIIRSLCGPNEENLENEEMNHQLMSDHLKSLDNKNVDASEIRRAILDRLLSGESGNDISPVNTLLPEYKISPRQKTKYVATLTAVQNHKNDFPSESGALPKQDNYESPFDSLTSSFDGTTHQRLPFSGNDTNVNFLEQSSSILLYPVKNEIISSKNDTVFLFPENNPLSDGVPVHSAVVTPVDSMQGKTPSVSSAAMSHHLNNSPYQIPATKIDKEIHENSTTSDDLGSRTCDFTNCLRPSKLQNSPFLEQITAKSMTYRTSPDIQSGFPASEIIPPNSGKNSTQLQNHNGLCDYANCLKPSQVQNSMFTAELSELTANKSSAFGSDLIRTNSPLTARTNSPAWSKSNILDPSNLKVEGKHDSNDQSDEEIRHKSEITITLQTPQKNKYFPTEEEIQNKEKKSQFDSNSVNAALPESIQAESPVTDLTGYLPSSEGSYPPIEQSLPQVSSEIPPPPPPPPSPSKHSWVNHKNIDTNVASLQSLIRNQHLNLINPQESCGVKPITSKSPVMLELQKRFESTRWNSSEGQQQESFDKSYDLQSELPDNKTDGSHEKRSDSSYLNHSPITAVPYKCNRNNGYSTEQRECISSLPNGRNENGTFKNDSPFSTKTLLTDEPPPPGAVLLEKKVTVEGDEIHTDKYYAIPVKEVLKETTSTTKFLPAPPKYEGIGPTEDGVPIGLRNSVKKENMHNWYKTMFKSLHKADSANDTQEYIIGYSSEPETTKTEKIMRKKSATLDNRSGNNNASRNFGNLQGYPPSAKSSIEVYNIRPRLIEDYEPGHSSVTDDEINYCSKRYLPPLNAPKPSYEFKNGYEQDNLFIRNLEQPEPFCPEEQKVWYKDIQKGGDIPPFGLGKLAPERPKDPIIGPLPPPPLNYNGPTILQQATRPLTLPANYSNQTDNGICQQVNGPYEMHMRQAIHTEMQQRISPSSSQLSSPTRSILKSPTRTPDLKIPAQVLFDFKAESSKEIALKKGDLVLILRQLDKNWYEGEHKGNIGIFPISYVEIVPPEHVSTATKSFVDGIGKVLFDFSAQTSVELSVRKGDAVNLLRRVDANWYEARFNNKKGIVPASYLQVLQEPTERNAFSPKPCIKSQRLSSGSIASPSRGNSNPSSPSSVSVTSPSSLDNNRSKFQTRGKKGSSLIEPVMFKAMYSYNPQNTDELELLEGDIVCVVEMCDDGWYVGTSVRTGVFGIFPGNYVEKV